MEELVGTIKQYIGAGSYDNEEAVRAQICYPILQALGWDMQSPVHVVPEYKVHNLKVDIALRRSVEEPMVFIEVKAPGKCSLQGQDQVFDYAARQNIRELDTEQQMALIVQRIQGKRLRYQDLIA